MYRCVEVMFVLMVAMACWVCMSACLPHVCMFAACVHVGFELVHTPRLASRFRAWLRIMTDYGNDNEDELRQTFYTFLIVAATAAQPMTDHSKNKQAEKNMKKKSTSTFNTPEALYF